MNNFDMFLNLSCYKIKTLVQKYINSENKDFMIFFTEGLVNSFSDEEKKNGYFFDSDEYSDIYDKTCFVNLCEEIESVFGVSTYYIDSIESAKRLNPEEFTNTIYHIPLIIVLDGDGKEDIIFETLKNVGEFANIVAIK
jgi:hypothetical protein